MKRLCLLLLLFVTSIPLCVFSQETYAELMKKAEDAFSSDKKLARSLYEKAAQLDDTKDEPWWGIYRSSFADSIQINALNNAIQRNPNVGKYYEYRGYFYNYLKQYDNRIADFRKWVELEPQNGKAHAQLAIALNQQNSGNPEVKTHFRYVMQLEAKDSYDVGQLKKNFPSLYQELASELGYNNDVAKNEEPPAPEVKPAPVKKEEPAPAKKKVNKPIPARKTVPEAPVVVIDEISSQFIDSCATVFSSSIDSWASQMANRSDIITAFTGCGSSDCRQSKFADLNSVFSAMSNNLSDNIYVLLYKNDSRLKNACASLGEQLGSAKWKFSEAGNQYESAATFAINLKKDYNNYSSDQRAQFIQLMFEAYDKADIAAQEGMKMLTDAYESYLRKSCPSLKPGSAFSDGNIVSKSFANAQAYLKTKLDEADAKQQQNLADAEKKKKAEEAANKKKAAQADAKDVTKATACSCCKGKGYITKQVAEFHKMSEKRVERVKKIENGKAITEVTYEPIGYTKYKTVKEICSCCEGTGKKE